jgi:hypothetical protein
MCPEIIGAGKYRLDMRRARKFGEGRRGARRRSSYLPLWQHLRRSPRATEAERERERKVWMGENESAPRAVRRLSVPFATSSKIVHIVLFNSLRLFSLSLSSLFPFIFFSLSQN